VRAREYQSPGRSCVTDPSGTRTSAAIGRLAVSGHLRTDSALVELRRERRKVACRSHVLSTQAIAAERAARLTR
jgi:hypothetical protein